MADEATPQETTENTSVEATAAAETIDTTADVGADVQGTEPASKAADSSKDSERPAAKSYDEAYVKKLRDEAAAARVKGKEAAEKASREAAEAAEKALTEKWAKALGLVKDDEPADPAELLKQAEEREKQIAAERDSAAERLRAYERKDAITKAVSSAEGDLESILDSRSINSAIEKLDTSADDFATQVAAIVKDAVEKNPKLKKVVQASAPRSGGDLTGGNAAPKPRGPLSVDDIRRAKREQRDRDRI
jgi:hypothetical protein